MDRARPVPSTQRSSSGSDPGAAPPAGVSSVSSTAVRRAPGPSPARRRTTAVPDRAVRPGHRAGRSTPAAAGSVGQLAGGEVVAVQGGAAGVGVHTSSAVRVRVEVGVHVAGQIDRQLGDRARTGVPDQQLVPAAALVADQQPLVAGHRRERHRVEPLAGTVGELGDHLAVGDADTPAAPGIGSHRARNAPAPRWSRRATARRRWRPPGAVHDLRVPSRIGQVDPGAVVVGEPGHHDVPADLQTGRVPGSDAGQRLDRRTGRTERLPPPRPELVAVLVVEPPQLAPVRAEHAAGGAVRSVGGLHAARPSDVPGVQLVGAGFVGHEDRPVRGVTRRVGQADPHGVEPGPPPRLGRRVVEQGGRDASGRVGGRIGHRVSLVTRTRRGLTVRDGQRPRRRLRRIPLPDLRSRQRRHRAGRRRERSR